MPKENPFDRLDVFIDTTPKQEKVTNQEMKVKPENLEKAKEVVAEAQMERSDFLYKTANSWIVKKTAEIIKTKAPDIAADFVPFLGGVKMSADAWRGKTLISKEELPPIARLAYVGGAIATEIFWTNALLDLVADTGMNKYVLMTKIPSLVLTAIAYAPGKEEILIQLANIQEKLGPPTATIFSQLGNAINKLDFTKIDFSFLRNNMEEKFKQLSINPQ